MKVVYIYFILILFNFYAANAQIYKKMPLIEVFTNVHCGNCYASEPYIDDVLEARIGKFTCIKYHSMNYPTDPMYIYDAALDNCQSARGSFYSSIVAGTPTAIVDGNMSTYYTTSTIPASFNNAVIDDIYGDTCAIQLKIKETLYGTTDSIKVTITNSGSTFVGTGLNLYIAVIEHPVYFATPPSSIYPMSSYSYVVREFISPIAGYALSALVLADGDSYTFTIPYTLPSSTSVVNANLRTIVFIQSPITKNVVQSLMGNSSTGTADVRNLLLTESDTLTTLNNETSQFSSVSYFNNQLFIFGYEAFDNIQLIDINGKILINEKIIKNVLNLNTLSKGTYLVQLKNNIKFETHKILIY